MTARGRLAVLIAAALAASCGGDDEPADRRVTTFVPKTSGSAGPPRVLDPQPQEGSARQVFARACGECHALRAAGADGFVGPDLDALRPGAERVRAAIANGGARNDVMPANLLVERDAARVARYVARVAGR
jgi:cytochrome c6